MAGSHLAKAALLAAAWFAHPSNAVGDAVAEHIVFVNGIGNTLEQALYSREQLVNAVENTPTRTAAQRRTFTYSLAYNPIGWSQPSFDLGGTLPENLRELFDDSIELFVLKVAEECFAADFVSIFPAAGSGSTSFDRTAATQVVRYLENMAPPDSDCASTVHTRSRRITAVDLAPTQFAVNTLVERVKANPRTVIVAHSEGNLLANLAFAALVRDLGDEARHRVRLVNVANTSQFSVHGLEVTHLGDRALEALEVLPTSLDGLGQLRFSPDWGKRSTCAEPRPCPFVLAPPSLGLGSGSGDVLAHGFVETYLSESTVPVAQSTSVVYTPEANRFVDRLVDTIYAAAQSLDPPPDPPAPQPTVSSVDCTAPFAGIDMVCVVAGTELPPQSLAAATNCAPAPMTRTLASASELRFTCKPQVAGLPVVITLDVPGAVLPEGLIPTRVAQAPPPSPALIRLNDTVISAFQCLSGFIGPDALVNCDAASAREYYPYQDGMLGRDVESPVGANGPLGMEFEEIPRASGGLHPRTECVRDAVTGLTWEGKPAEGFRAATRRFRAVGEGSEAEVAAYVAEVNAAGLCGYSDWRLPTLVELQSIVIYGVGSFSAPVAVNISGPWFPNTLAGKYLGAPLGQLTGASADLMSQSFGHGDFGTGSVAGHTTDSS